jgi:cytochrome c553
MKHPAVLAMLGFAAALATDSIADESQAPPPWAYVVNPPGLVAPADDGTPLSVPGSAKRFTLTQLRDVANVPDWHPDDHPPMPPSVARGPGKGVFACGFCHLPNGLGRPENASLAGLPAEYIVRQVAAFRSGERRSAEPRSLPVNFMVSTAQGVSEAEVREAAEYFAALPLLPWIRVVETDTVPVTHVTGWMLAAAEPVATEPIGARIIEMPEDLERTERRDPRSGFVAHVPIGSIARGEALVATGGGRTTPCGVCHGADLRGLGPVPGLAGRSPSYIVRQLHDLRRGLRSGGWSPLMQPVVAKLTDDDIIDIAAYTASRAP